MAFLLERYEFPGRRLLSVLVLVPMALPPLVGVLSFTFLYGESGIFPRFFQQLFSLDEVPFALKGHLGGSCRTHFYNVHILLLNSFCCN